MSPSSFQINMNPTINKRFTRLTGVHRRRKHYSRKGAYKKVKILENQERQRS